MTYTRKALNGKTVLFHGWDGVCYPAKVVDVRKGIAIIEYVVRAETIRAYAWKSQNRLEFVRTY